MESLSGNLDHGPRRLEKCRQMIATASSTRNDNKGVKNGHLANFDANCYIFPEVYVFPVKVVILPFLVRPIVRCRNRGTHCVWAEPAVDNPVGISMLSVIVVEILAFPVRRTQVEVKTFKNVVSTYLLQIGHMILRMRSGP